MSRWRGRPRIRQFLIYPAVDAAGDQPSRVENARGHCLKQPTMDCYGYHVGAWDDAKDPRLSPLHAADLAGLPPAVIVTAEYDVLRRVRPHARRCAARAWPPTSVVTTA